MAIVLSTMPSCQILKPEHEVRTYQARRYFGINKDSILASLAQGKTDVFTPLITEPDGRPLFSDDPVKWSSADYYRIAITLQEYFLGESVNDWTLNNMGFRLTCQDINQGPQEGNFEFFKTLKTRERESRLVSSIFIEPWRNTVSIQEREDYPKLVDWRVIDWADLKISAEQALQISETNGAAEARASVENACNIGLILAPNAMFAGWQVGYETNDRKDLFNTYINPMTGKFQIIPPENK
jgi:hypothetical protein